MDSHEHLKYGDFGTHDKNTAWTPLFWTSNNPFAALGGFLSKQFFGVI